MSLHPPNPPPLITAIVMDAKETNKLGRKQISTPLIDQSFVCLLLAHHDDVHAKGDKWVDVN